MGRGGAGEPKVPMSNEQEVQAERSSVRRKRRAREQRPAGVCARVRVCAGAPRGLGLRVGRTAGCGKRVGYWYLSFHRWSSFR